MKNRTNTVLWRSDDINIEQCSCCDTISLLCKNILLKFSPESYREFSRLFRGLDFDRRSILFENGTEKMVVSTKQKEIQLCFDEAEFDLLCRALKEAELMLEVRQILSH